MSHAPTGTLDRRHATLRHALARQSLDALVVTAMPNVQHLTNFAGSSAIVVLTAAGLSFVTDFRYVTEIEAGAGAADACPGLALTVVDSSYDETLADVLAALPGRRAGFEAAHLTVARHQWLEAKLRTLDAGVELIPTTGLVEAVRVRKDAYEVAALREGGRRLSAVARDLLPEVAAGRTEREIAQAIESLIRRAGFERPAFETIVAAGPNGALPHARPGRRRLSEGDLVVLDFGGVYDSYCVDLTRTISVGPATTRAREVYQAVLEAHDRALESVAPGRSRFAIDAAARDTLARHGLGEAFGHGTGHGLGLEVHEEPRISRRRRDEPPGDDAVAAGMVFTIEPGAYLPGWGGVRIEDDVLVTAAGHELLTTATTELIEV